MSGECARDIALCRCTEQAKERDKHGGLLSGGVAVDSPTARAVTVGFRAAEGGRSEAGWAETPGVSQDGWRMWLSWETTRGTREAVTRGEPPGSSSLLPRHTHTRTWELPAGTHGAHTSSTERLQGSLDPPPFPPGVNSKGP